jgi:hypothetical protein
MVISNSTNVNAREALIEYALRRLSMAYQRVLIFAKHFFRDSVCRGDEIPPRSQELGARRLRRFIVHHLWNQRSSRLSVR